MTKLTAILIIALTCATLHAQSVIVKGTGAGAVRGTTTITTNVSSVATNLSATGTNLNPDCSGTNYVQISDNENRPRWYNIENTYYIYNTGGGYYISKNGVSFPSGEPHWERGQDTITGSYPPHVGATGTVVVAYWYQTNFASTVSVKGIATP